MNKAIAAATINTKAKAKEPSKSSRQENDDNIWPILPITWTATEPGPHKRWWWYIGFCIVMLWLISLLALIHDWFLLALAVAVTFAALVTYGRKPKQLSYRLDKQTLTINEQTLRMDNYRAFTFEQTRAKDKQIVTVLLLPKRRFSPSSQIALPEYFDETTKVLNAFEEVLPFDEAEGYLASLRFFDRIARWLRLN